MPKSSLLPTTCRLHPVQPDRILATSWECALDEHLHGLRQETVRVLTLWRIRIDMVEAVELCVSELYGNVVRHASGPCTVIIRTTTTGLRLVVRDSNRNIPLIPTTVDVWDLEAEHGRGLTIVRQLSDRFVFEPMRSHYSCGKSAIVDWEIAA